VQYVLYNDERIEFNEKCRPVLGTGRAVPHFSGLGEEKFEKEFIEKMKAEGFKENNSAAIRWFRSIFPEVNIKHEKVRGLAEFFAFKLGARLGREIYRRRACLLYWIQERLEEISKLLSANTMFVCCDNKLYQMVPPFQNAPQKPQQLMAPQTVAVLQNDFAIFDSFDSFEDGQIDFGDVDNELDDSFMFQDMTLF
jgi:hypothetical protein